MSSVNSIEELTAQTGNDQQLSSSDVKHNMVVNIALDAIFSTGAADLAVVVSPLWVFLGASNTMVGLVALASMIGLIGVIVSPWITIRFRYKKWYMFICHLPYIGAWLVIGLGLLFSHGFGLSNHELLTFVVVMTIANSFFAGFVSLPHQEYVAACIPMSHRGRYLGYSWSIGALLAAGSMAIGGLILLRVAKPMAFGWLYLMTWAFCQGGYVFALFARERPTPVEKAPQPWTKVMLSALWRDKAFLRVVVLWSIFNGLLAPVFVTYISLYGFRDLKMIAAAAAIIGGINQVVRVTMSSVIGNLTDRFSSKLILPFCPLIAFAALLPLLFVHNQYGVYISTALSALYMLVTATAFTPLLYGLPSPENRGGHFTMQLLLQYATNAVGPLLIGVLCDTLSYRSTFALAAVAAVILVPITKRVTSELSADAHRYS